MQRLQQGRGGYLPCRALQCSVYCRQELHIAERVACRIHVSITLIIALLSTVQVNKFVLTGSGNVSRMGLQLECEV